MKMKNGYIMGMVAGAIAGVVGALAASIAFMAAVILGLPWPPYPISSVLTITFMTSHVTFEIMYYLVFGPIYGVIYSMYYDSTPGKGILKGLVFGLFLFLISNFYYGVLVESWGLFGEVGGAIGPWWMGFFTLTTYGIVLGALYKKPIRAISEYNVKSGVFSGAIAGVITGVVAIISLIMGVILGVWERVPGILSATFFTASHIFEIVVAIVFGAIFGVIYSMYHDSTPGKGILKGLVFGLILFFISRARIAILIGGYGYINTAIIITWHGFFTFFVYGIVLSLLYKPKK
jgi:hypothetical protein